MASYKVLDVREREVPFTKQYNTHLENSSHTVYVIIAEDTKKHRCRFVMYDKYIERIAGEVCYLGYTGDFDLIVKGDWIEIEQTDTWPNVAIYGHSC